MSDSPENEDPLWFMPPEEDDQAQADMPWPVAARETSLEPEVWQAAEQAEYRALVVAATEVSRFGERLRHFPAGTAERFALGSVAAILRHEGIWLGPEEIALFRELRTGADDSARDLARASWAVRRLLGPDTDPFADLHGFLGRDGVSNPQMVPGEERPVGEELRVLGEGLARGMEGVGECHPLTRAAFVFALWRRDGITPWDEVLEPTVAAMRIGAGTAAPFLPMSAGQRPDRHGLTPGASGAGSRLRVFYEAVQAGALAALMELERLERWQVKAAELSVDLSGRTPPLLISALIRHPVVSAELVAQIAGVSPVSARRNLNLLTQRGLLRETTGQDRFRFWAAAL